MVTCSLSCFMGSKVLVALVDLVSQGLNVPQLSNDKLSYILHGFVETIDISYLILSYLQI